MLYVSPGMPASQCPSNGGAVILYIQPVANLLAVAINRQRLAAKRIDDHEGDKLFGKLIRTVVVGAICGEYRQAIGMMICAHQMVAGAFTRRVGAVGLVLMRFCKSGLTLRQRAVHLVGRYMEKTEILPRFFVQLVPIRSNSFEQPESAHNIGLDKGFRTVNGSINVAFRGKMYYWRAVDSAEEGHSRGRYFRYRP